MFEKLISEALNNILGAFIEDINPAQLNISITSGKVKLENMRLKSTLFDAYPLPFSLAFGQIGLIDLTIPVWNMFSSPLIIEIQDVFALVKPKLMSEWNEQVEQESFKKSTKEYLDQFELFQQNFDNLQKKDPSSIDKLLAKIIDNVQVKIKNVYIRYEDQKVQHNQQQQQFAFGILLKELQIFTTGQDWQNKNLQIGQEIMHKVATITEFSIFLDYQNPNILLSEEESEHTSLIFDIQKFLNDNTNKVFKNVLINEFDEDKFEDLLGSFVQNIDHHFLLDKFSMEVRAKINKNPISNLLPQVDMDIILGSQFEVLEEQKQNEDKKV